MTACNTATLEIICGAVRAAQAEMEARCWSLRFLPSYSPDLNPIELVFSKPKRLLRSTAARTVDALGRGRSQPRARGVRA